MTNPYPHAHARISLISFLLASMAFLLTIPRAGAEVGDGWRLTPWPKPWGDALIRAVTYQNQLWVSTVSNDPSFSHHLWASSDGTTWTLIKQSLPLDYNLRYDLVVFQDRLWAVGISHYNWAGMTNPNCVISSLYGKNWTVAATKVPWNYGNLGSTVVFNNKLFVVNVATSTSVGAVYSSSDGSHWTLETASLPWKTRLKPAIVVFAGKIWMMGGAERYGGFDVDPPCPFNYNNDIWCSADGKTWTRTAYADWLPRYGMTACVHDGKLWLMCGSYMDEIELNDWPYYKWVRYSCNDVWWSYDGIQWSQKPGINIGGVDFDSLSYDHKLWIVCGCAMYTGRPPGIPMIKPIADQIMTEGGAYSSSFPELNQGDYPVTWSLVNPPAGIVINPDTGLVSLPQPRTSGSPYSIRLRATNSLGSGETSWTLTVNAQPPAQISAPAVSIGCSTVVAWTSVPTISGYSIQRAETPDFTSPLETISVSTVTLQHTFSGLTEGKTYWYRVQGKKLNGLTSLWSEPIACAQLSAIPAGWIYDDPRVLEWPLAGAARVRLAVPDPGSNPTRPTYLRVSTDRINWTPWQSYLPSATVWVGHAGVTSVYAQIHYNIGDTFDLATSATVAAGGPNMVFVDERNNKGPWRGSLEQPYRRIQDALNSSTTGTTIIVAPGIYRENLAFNGKSVLLRSADPLSRDLVKTTLIAPQYTGSAITFNGGETPQCQVAGFTITHGIANDSHAYQGGGIFGNHTHATIRFNRIVNNYAGACDSRYDAPVTYSYYYGFGGGIASCDGLIENNLIACNGACANPSVDLSGLSSSSTEVTKKYRTYTTSMVGGYASGGALEDCNGVIQNNTIWNNEAGWQGYGTDSMSDNEDGMSPGAAIDSCKGVIRNNIVLKFNYTAIDSCSTPTYSCFPGWIPGTGNITADPRLADPAHGDFHLLADSPCIDAGMFVPGLLRDMDGEARGFDAGVGSRGDGSHFDIGADEYHPLSPAVQVLEPHGGESLKAQDVFRIQVALDPARAGERVRLELRNAQGKTLKAWSFPAPGGNLLIFQHLPDVDGADFRFRALSESNTALFDQSPPFEIHRVLGNAVAPRSWRHYQ